MKSDLHEPGHHTTFAAVAVKASVNQDERLLGDVRCLLRVAREPEAECNDLRPMGAKEPVERGFALPSCQQGRDPLVP